jgi:hypothetical protein
MDGGARSEDWPPSNLVRADPYRVPQSLAHPRNDSLHAGDGAVADHIWAMAELVQAAL